MKRVTVTIYLEENDPLIKKLIDLADRTARHPKGKKVLTFYDLEKAMKVLQILAESKE